MGDPQQLPKRDAASRDAKLARLTADAESLQVGRARIRLTGAWEALQLQEDDAKRPLRGTATARRYDRRALLAGHFLSPTRAALSLVRETDATD